MPSTYTTTQGDTWDLIAYRLWDDETRMHLLLAANPQQQEVAIFSAGVVLDVPELPASAPAATLPPWRR